MDSTIDLPTTDLATASPNGPPPQRAGSADGQCNTTSAVPSHEEAGKHTGLDSTPTLRYSFSPETSLELLRTNALTPLQIRHERHRLAALGFDSIINVEDDHIFIQTAIELNMEGPSPDTILTAVQHEIGKLNSNVLFYRRS